jgi:hypothetical protein
MFSVSPESLPVHISIFLPASIKQFCSNIIFTSYSLDQLSCEIHIIFASIHLMIMLAYIVLTYSYQLVYSRNA